MSEPQQSALADLARALEAAGVRRSAPDHFGGMTIWIPVGGDFPAKGYISASGELSIQNRRYPAEMLDVLSVIRRWQAPPRPDAAAFEVLIEKYWRAVIHEEDVRESTTDPHRQRSARLDTFAAKAALLAFAPSADAATITEERLAAMESVVNAAKKLERALEPPECYDMQNMADAQGEILQALYDLDAVAAARQRATGSGVRADNGEKVTNKF